MGDSFPPPSLGSLWAVGHTGIVGWDPVGVGEEAPVREQPRLTVSDWAWNVARAGLPLVPPVVPVAA